MAQHFSQLHVATAGTLTRLCWVQAKTIVYGISRGHGKFNGDLRLEYLDGRNWKLIDPFSYIASDGLTILVPAEFVTDFASVPRIFWAVLPPTGDYGPAALVHDACYRMHLVSRERADALLLEAMKTLGVAAWKRAIIYGAVRIFGGRAYSKGKS